MLLCSMKPSVDSLPKGLSLRFKDGWEIERWGMSQWVSHSCSVSSSLIPYLYCSTKVEKPFWVTSVYLFEEVRLKAKFIGSVHIHAWRHCENFCPSYLVPLLLLSPRNLQILILLSYFFFYFFHELSSRCNTRRKFWPSKKKIRF